MIHKEHKACGIFSVPWFTISTVFPPGHIMSHLPGLSIHYVIDICTRYTGSYLTVCWMGNVILEMLQHRVSPCSIYLKNIKQTIDHNNDKSLNQLIKPMGYWHLKSPWSLSGKSLHLTFITKRLYSWSPPIPFVQCQSALPFLGYSYFNIWPWKSMVKAMCVVSGQGHIVGSATN